MNSILTIQSLYSKYTSSQKNTDYILKDINLDFKKGKITGILGRNGAGKSTLLRTIAGVLKASSGSIEFCGKNITDSNSRQVIQSGISFVPQERECFLDFTVEENIKAALLPLNLSSFEIKEKIRMGLNYFKQIQEHKAQLVYNLSGGIRQMLIISMGFVQEPLCILLDEPSLGLSNTALEQMKIMIEGYVRNGGTVIIVEQKSLIFELADYIHVVDNGSVILSGQPAMIKNDETFKNIYLGLKQN